MYCTMQISQLILFKFLKKITKKPYVSCILVKNFNVLWLTSTFNLTILVHLSKILETTGLTVIRQETLDMTLQYKNYERQ